MRLRTVQSDGEVGGSKQQVGTSTQFPSWGGVLDFSQSETFHGECYIILKWERFVFWGHANRLVRVCVCLFFLTPNLFLNICIIRLWTFGHKVVLCAKKKINNKTNSGLSVSSNWNKQHRLSLSCMTAAELQLFLFFFFSPHDKHFQSGAFNLISELWPDSCPAVCSPEED